MSGPEVLTETQVRMAWPLGQTGVAAYPHTPRLVTGLEGVERPPAPFVLQGRRPVRPEDDAPASVGQLVRREGGAAFYWAALWREGGETRPGARRDADVEEGAKARARVATPALDRWVLDEQIVVVWDRAAVRGFRIWRRRGRSGWSVRCTWRRSAVGVLAIARGAA